MDDKMKSELHFMNICWCLNSSPSFLNKCNGHNLIMALKNDERFGPHSFSPLLDGTILKTILEKAIRTVNKNMSQSSTRKHATNIFKRVDDPITRNALIQLLFPEHNNNNASAQPTSTPSAIIPTPEPIIIEDEFLNDIIPENVLDKRSNQIELPISNNTDHMVVDDEIAGCSHQLYSETRNNAKKPSQTQRNILRKSQNALAERTRRSERLAAAEELLRTTERIAKSNQRSNLAESQKDSIRAEDNISHHATRANETQSQLKTRQETERRRHAIRKSSYIPIYIASMNQTEAEALAPFNVGMMNSVCKFCDSINFERELVGPSNHRYFSICCKQGKIVLPPRNKTHQYIESLMNGQDANSKHFMTNIRAYNCALAFVSYSSDIDLPRRPTNALPVGIGKYCFVVQGAVHHYISTAKGASKPMYGSLYYYDTQTALNHRLKYRDNQAQLKPEILQSLDSIIRQCNPHAMNYQLMHQKMDEQKRLATEMGVHQPRVRMVIADTAGLSNGRYNIPTAGDVAGVYVADEDGVPSQHRGIVVHEHGGKLKKIPILNNSLDSLAYPLIFLYGELGYTTDQKHQGPFATTKRNEMTYNEWAGYQFTIRPGFSPLHSAGKLFQQYIVDISLRIESTRLNFIRSKKGQKQLRSEDYTSLKEFVQRRAEKAGLRPGKQVILPSSFNGGPRFMRNLYLDCMSVATYTGFPSLFITFSFNPNCDELKSILLPHECSEHRPDLVARIFNLQLKELIKDLTEVEVFGKHVAFMYNVEFQKRGLPHAHILLTLESQITDTELIDKFISAEVPDPEEFPSLYEKVSRLMLHKACGKLNPHAPCNDKDDVCKKGFPKKQCMHTNANVKGYPEYRRRVKHVVSIGKHQYDSRHVIPYNSYLLQKYNSHINVEVCSSLKCIKYITKYIHKGSDAANLNITRTTGDGRPGVGSGELIYDEVQMYIDCRFMSSVEAAFKIFNFKMHDCSHSVVRLWVHCEGMQTITFEEGEEAEALARHKISTLMAYFTLNKEDVNARQYLYAEIPRHYVFKQRELDDQNGNKSKEWAWVARKRGGDKMIGRIYEVPPRDSERFHLRILLQNVKGAQNFKHLRTVDGNLYPTYQSACRALGLIEDDRIWISTLQEASIIKMGTEYRRLFVNILVFNNPTNPLDLWNKFQKNLIDDYMHKNEDENICISQCLHEIKRQLLRFGKTLNDYDLPEPQFGMNVHSPTSTTVITYDTAQQKEYGDQQYATLTPEQMCIVNFIYILFEQSTKSETQELSVEDLRRLSIFADVSKIRTIQDLRLHLTRSIYIDASAGTGKTFMYKCLLHMARGLGLKAVCTAYTGLAALLMQGGRTCHSVFKLPRLMYSNSVSSMKLQTSPAEELKKAELIIFDEAPTIPKTVIKLVDRLLRDVMQIDKPFGDKLVLLAGDFRQTLPIVPNGSRSQQVAASIKKSPLFPNFLQMRLTKNMRSEKGAEEFSKYVLSIGDGTAQFEEDRVRILGDDIVVIPPECVVEDSIIEKVFGELIDPKIDTSYHNQVVLCATNQECFKINPEILELIKTNMTEYLSRDSAEVIDGEECSEYPVEYLHSITPSGMPEHRLQVKVGSLIMLICNFDPDSGLCNGTRLEVLNMHPHVIHARIITEGLDKTEVFIPKVMMKKSDELPFTLCRLQFPVRTCFSMTINKAQGQSFNRVGVHLSKPVFAHGQLYVAFSRAKSFEGLFVKIDETYNQGVLRREGLPDVHYTTNIVYREILQGSEETGDGADLPPIPIPDELNPPEPFPDNYDVIALAQHEVYDNDNLLVVEGNLGDIEPHGDEEHIGTWGDDYTVDEDQDFEMTYDESESEDIEAMELDDNSEIQKALEGLKISKPTFKKRKKQHFDFEITECSRSWKRKADMSNTADDSELHTLSKRMTLIQINSTPPVNSISTHGPDFVKHLDPIRYFNMVAPVRKECPQIEPIDPETQLRIDSAQNLLTKYSNQCPEPYDLSYLPDPNRIPTLYEQQIPFLNDHYVPTITTTSPEYRGAQIVDTRRYQDHTADAIFRRECLVTTQTIVQPLVHLTKTRTLTMDSTNCLRTGSRQVELETSGTIVEVQHDRERRLHAEGILESQFNTVLPSREFSVVTGSHYQQEHELVTHTHGIVERKSLTVHPRNCSDVTKPRV